jgi:filamentous hemagglutinin family protein
MIKSEVRSLLIYADIILNEVGSTNRSVLNGALEVFGKNAAVVIANPNGFDCNGCDFASRVVIIIIALF